MDKLILLVGPSGSGKTTIAKELEKEGYSIIHSYTTRPPREPNEWGHTFIDNKEYLENITLTDEIYRLAYKDSKMIAFFNEYSKGEVYFATKEQYRGKGTSIYVVDPNGAEQVKRNVDDAEVVTIFLMCSEYVRLRRLQRDRGMTEALDRVRKDREIFSQCKCDYVVDSNRDIDQVTRDIREIIEQF